MERVRIDLMAQVKNLKRITLTNTVSDYHGVEDSWMFVEYVISMTKG